MRLYVAALALAAFACGSGEPPDLCDAAPTYSVDIKPIADDKCVACHSSTKLGTARNGAPMELNYDDYVAITPNRSAFANAITSGAMPPRDNPMTPPSTTGAERTAVAEWRRCGFPE